FTAGRRTLGKTRLMSFSLGGKAEMPDTTWVEPPLPDLPPLEASRQTIEHGAELFESRGCNGCHGKNAVARVGGTVPDLRYASKETHLQWNGIVIGGARSAKGMPAHEMSTEDAQAIEAYVLSRAYELKNSRD
ncbi:MAG: cytochrome c, partial [Lysobacterales bacterium]